MRDNIVKITQLPKNPYALGIAAQFLSGQAPFSQFEFGPTVSTIYNQISNATHLIAERDDKIVGYMGWLRTTDKIAQDWLKKGTKLKQDKTGSAVAVTIFLAENSKDTIKMIKAAKRMEPDASVYWKRYFTDDRPPSPRVVRKRR